MSFEKDYEKGLRDKHWGRAFQHFAKGGAASEVSRDMKTALCGVLREKARSGEAASILTVADLFGAYHRQVIASNQRRMIADGGIDIGLIVRFQEACAPVLRSEENSNIIQSLYGLAVEQLEDAQRGTATIAPETASAQQTLLVEFLHQHIETRMRPATVIAEQKGKIGPEVAEARLQQAISQTPLSQIAGDFLAGKGEKLRAPRSARPTDVQFAGMSLLKSRKP